MTSNTVDRLVDHYLTRLTDAAQVLPPDRRAELLSEIREHIAASKSAGSGAEEAAVRTMLDRLGEPADIVAAAMDDDAPEQPAYPPAATGRRRGLALEVMAVVMLTVGSLIPVIGWFAGVGLLWSSGVWRRSEKLLGTLIFPGGPGGILILGPMLAFALPSQTCAATTFPPVAGQATTAAQACTGFALPSGIGIALVLILLMAPVVVGIVLLNRARSRTALEDR